MSGTSARASASASAAEAALRTSLRALPCLPALAVFGAALLLGVVAALALGGAILAVYRRRKADRDAAESATPTA